MIRERPDVASKRDECRMALRALKDAVAALESLPADLISRINGAPADRGAPCGRPPLRIKSVGAAQAPRHHHAQALNQHFCTFTSRRLTSSKFPVSQLLELLSPRRRSPRGERAAAMFRSLWCAHDGHLQRACDDILCA
jgi:hypothetical protein